MTREKLNKIHTSNQALKTRWIIGILVVSGCCVAFYLWQHRTELPLTVKDRYEKQHLEDLQQSIDDELDQLQHQLDNNGDVVPD